MSAEFYRKEYGETPEGYVVVVGRRGGVDERNPEGDVTYEVRQGVRTVCTVATELRATAVAKALAG